MSQSSLFRRIVCISLTYGLGIGVCPYSE